MIDAPASSADAASTRYRQVRHARRGASLALETLSNASRDHQEAVTAFGEKRKPVFGR